MQLNRLLGIGLTLTLCMASGLTSIATVHSKEGTADANPSTIFSDGQLKEMSRIFRPLTLPLGNLRPAAMKIAAATKDVAEPNPQRLPSMEEYIVLNCKRAVQDANMKNRSLLSEYRIALTTYYYDPQNIKCLTEARNLMVVPAAGGRGDLKYCFWLFFLSKHAEAPPKQVSFLFDTLIQRDLRYYALDNYGHDTEIDYLVLLLDDQPFSNLALQQLQRVEAAGLRTILHQLMYPYNVNTQLEQKLLTMLKGRDSEAAPFAKKIVASIENDLRPQLEKLVRQLTLKNVPNFTPEEIAAMLGGKPAADRLRAKKIREIADMTSPAFQYLDSRTALMRSIIDNANRTEK